MLSRSGLPGLHCGAQPQGAHLQAGLRLWSAALRAGVAVCILSTSRRRYQGQVQSVLGRSVTVLGQFDPVFSVLTSWFDFVFLGIFLIYGMMMMMSII